MVSTDASTESRDMAPSKSKMKKDSGERRKQASQAQQNRARANVTKADVNRQLSCAPQSRGGGGPDPQSGGDIEEQQKMLKHLKEVDTFNGRWKIKDVINSGSYGVVFAVQDIQTNHEGVIKIARAAGADSIVNIQAEWESFLLMKIYQSNPDASIVRLLDKGVLQNYDGSPLEYMCLEYAAIQLRPHLLEYSGDERKLRCCQIALMSLKGIYDLHKEGLLHRDLKPENMGILSRKNPVVVIYDLGMARMYTDGQGKVRPIRSTAGFRGTPEWASGNAGKGREQTRYDDLIAWLYCMIDLFSGDDAKDSHQTFPWSSRSKNGKENQYFKGLFAPAKYLFRNCPRAFLAMNTYIRTHQAVRPFTVPDYGYLADRCKDAMEEVVPGSSTDLSIMTRPLPEKPAEASVICSKENVGTPASAVAGGAGSKEALKNVPSKEAVKNV